MDTREKTITMSEREAAEFELFKAESAKKLAREKAKEDRDTYKVLVDDEVNAAIVVLSRIGGLLGSTKARVFDQFRSILDMKADVLKLTKDDQRSHTFTNSEGTARITLGVYVTDGYRDTVEDGIEIVKQYLKSLVNDDKSAALVGMVMRLLSRDAKGTLKASRIIQLRKAAEDTGDERFIEGVRIIEESYQPAISKQFIKAEKKDRHGAWVAVPLGMTEAEVKPVESEKGTII